MGSQEQPLISVIIPTMNRAELVGQTLLCVLEQSYKNLEIIVVDDASTDATVETIKSIDDVRVRYLRLEKNSGPSGARNAGVRAAHGELVAFLDSDDRWDKQKTALQLVALLQHPDPANTVAYTKALVIGNSRSYLLPTRGKRDDEPVADYVCGDEGLIHTSSLMFSRDLVVATPFLMDQKVCEDWDLLLRLEARGVNWLYLDKPLITWNNDYRPGRLSLSWHEGRLTWLEEHKRYMSERACHAFALKAIVKPLIHMRKRKLYTLRTLVRAWHARAVSGGQFMKLVIKIFFPRSLLKQIRAQSRWLFGN